jgi:diguanylate cyclase (GGDEF)-like protein
MGFTSHSSKPKVVDRLHRLVFGPQALAVLPAVILAGYWWGGQVVLVVASVIFPVAYWISTHFSKTHTPELERADATTGLPRRNAAIFHADRILADGEAKATMAAALVVGIDEMEQVGQNLGAEAWDKVLKLAADRVSSELRQVPDIVARLDGPRLCAVLSSGSKLDLEALIQITARLQRALRIPMDVGHTRVFVTASIGFCPASKLGSVSGVALIEAAEAAQAYAASQGAGSIRAYSPEIKEKVKQRQALSDQLPMALDTGEIQPWFQPQIKTQTGELIGVEVLARWEHPKAGIVSPAEFLPMVEEQGLGDRLLEVMLASALTSLQNWDRAGLSVPGISVNFSSAELRNPEIVDKVKWELDRFSIDPGRFTVEIVETVAARADDDVILRNIEGFRDLGCKIDLDDFGTGNASITSIKRFAAHRIKIDRSFVTKVDTDEDQQNLIRAILSMADGLGLQTLAEGVETPEEHEALREMGCDFLQGFEIARPMPFADVEVWLETRSIDAEQAGKTQSDLAPTKCRETRENAPKTA